MWSKKNHLFPNIPFNAFKRCRQNITGEKLSNWLLLLFLVIKFLHSNYTSHHQTWSKAINLLHGSSKNIMTIDCVFYPTKKCYLSLGKLDHCFDCDVFFFFFVNALTFLDFEYDWYILCLVYSNLWTKKHKSHSKSRKLDAFQHAISQPHKKANVLEVTNNWTD